jgi:hypothetical protein
MMMDVQVRVLEAYKTVLGAWSPSTTGIAGSGAEETMSALDHNGNKRFY